MAELELTIRDYWLILRRRRWVAVGAFIIILTSAVVITKFQPVLYKAHTTARIVSHRTLGSLLAELLTETATIPIDSEIKIVKSRAVLERVAREMNLISEDDTDREVYDATLYLSSIITCDRIGETDLIRIEVVHPDPNKAAEIANTTVEAYKLENLLEKNKQARNLREFLEGQLTDIKGRLKKSEDDLQKFKEKEKVTGVAITLANSLANLETEKSKLLRTYTEKHPDIFKLNEQIVSLKQQMAGISSKELEFARLSREVELNENTYKTFQARFEEVRIAEAEKVSDVSIIDYASAPKFPFKPNVVLNIFLGITLGVVVGLSSALVTEQFDTSLGTIEGIENTLKLPVLSVVPFLTFEKEERKGFFKKLPFVLPAKQNTILQLKSQMTINYSPKSSIAESYKMLYTNLRLEGFGGTLKNKIVQFTSSSPEEGKSITTINLAITMAQEGLKVLLVDGDLRRPVVHKVFGFNKEPGLTDILMGAADVKNAVKGVLDIMVGAGLDLDRLLKTPGIDNLFVLSSGTSVANVTQLLDSPAMTSLFENLRQSYDIVLLDSPPVLAVSDPLATATKVDGVVLVYRVGKTARDAISRVKVQLEAVKAPIKGIVLNNISPDVEMYSTYYYHYKYYGEKQKREEKTD